MLTNSYFNSDIKTFIEIDNSTILGKLNQNHLFDSDVQQKFAWQNINSPKKRLYLKNAYRVLLTRARQGMIIFMPSGDDSDPTRPRAYYDQTFEYLASILNQKIKSKY
jgi:Uncharacterized conserved protein (DUF2075)